MRRQLVRTTAYAVIAAMLVVLLRCPCSACGWSPSARSRGDVAGADADGPQPAGARRGSLAVALVIVALALALVQRLSRRLTEPLTELVEAAEAGTGHHSARPDPLGHPRGRPGLGRADAQRASR